jgi:predicted PhzF superfamily epimerase YddE/YHI9
MKIFQVDAFTEVPFGGNPAAVCLLETDAEDVWMQQVAAEMNASETAFVWKMSDGFRLRWFTPVSEVDLCGHATLASAHILWETEVLSPETEARFHTLSGLLKARKVTNGIQLDFPAEPAEECDAPEGLLESLGTKAVWVGRNRMDYLVEVESEEAVHELKVDFGALSSVDSRGVMVTSKGSGQYDFISRFFAPLLGVNEDPVTGSAHCSLGPYWGERLAKSDLYAFQASQRGGEIAVSVVGDRVLLTGKAITVLSCSLKVGGEGIKGMQTRKSYQEQMEKQFDRLCVRIDRVLGRVEGDTRGGFQRVATEISGKQGAVEEKLAELKESSGEAWTELKPGVDRAWSELKSALEKASSSFKK